MAVALKILLGRRCPPILLKVSNDLDRHDQPGWFRVFYRFWLKVQGGCLDHFVGMETPMRDEIREPRRVGGSDHDHPRSPPCPGR
ncbi:hypothetical protein ACRAWD_26535 [Caulobacter segnis]